MPPGEVRRGITYGVWNINGCCARVDGTFHNATAIINMGTPIATKTQHHQYSVGRV